MDVAHAIVRRASELCFSDWYKQQHMDTELYREFTILLAKNFRELGLHGQGADFVDRSIKLLKKVRFDGRIQTA